MNKILLNRSIKNHLSEWENQRLDFFDRYLKSDIEVLDLIDNEDYDLNSEYEDYIFCPIHYSKVIDNIQTFLMRLFYLENPHLDKLPDDINDRYKVEKIDYVTQLQELFKNYISKFKDVEFKNSDKRLEEKNHYLKIYLDNLILSENYLDEEKTNLTAQIKLLETEKVNMSEIENKSLLSWENKTELTELIQALFLSKAIKKEGKEIQQNELIEIFSNLFNCDLKTFNSLLNQGINNKTKTLFTSKLVKLIEDYKTNKDQLKKRN